MTAPRISAKLHRVRVRGSTLQRISRGAVHLRADIIIIIIIIILFLFSRDTLLTDDYEEEQRGGNFHSHGRSVMSTGYRRFAIAERILVFGPMVSLPRSQQSPRIGATRKVRQVARFRGY